MAKIIADIGSCHNGKLEYAIEAIDIASAIGLYALKFQFFPKRYEANGNIQLSKEWWPELKAYSEGKVQIFASAFDEDMEWYLLTQPSIVKFAYSQRNHPLIKSSIEAGCETIVSCDVMSDSTIPDGAKKLYCIPEYPVRYEIAFDDLFPRFDGFSDHTLGYRQSIKAITAGAKILEKHMTLDHADIKVPDSYFALTPNQMEKLVKQLWCY